MLYTLSRNSTEIVQCLSCTAEDVSHQTLLVQKSGETLTPLNTRESTVTNVTSGDRNVGAGSSRIGITWYSDSAMRRQTGTARDNVVLGEAEGDTPEVVGKVDVVVLEAELRVGWVRSDSGAPEVGARRTEY